MQQDLAPSERRSRQRFVARRRGEYCFWVTLSGERLPLQDLSLDGFGVDATLPFEVDMRFSFMMTRAGVPDRIEGVAKVANRVCSAGAVLTGFVFETFEADGKVRLEEWLAAHVLASATVPITERDATAIVSGPSLV